MPSDQNRWENPHGVKKPPVDASALAMHAADAEARLPLVTLLSQVWVAFTIECDNEAERQMPHRTANHGATPGALHTPWLTSSTMWANCMQYVGDEGITVRELERRARTMTNLHGMQRWGYITVESAGSRSKSPGPHSVIRATPGGRMAQSVWIPMGHVIEQRWQQRFGAGAIEQLRAFLSALVGQFDANLPDCLPILGYGLVTRASFCDHPVPPGHPPDDVAPLPLSALLARALVAFAIEFECEADVSIAIGANILRLCREQSPLIRDLPRLSGVSKEAIAMALSYLEKRGFAVVGEEAPDSKRKALTLTPKGGQARDTYLKLVGEIEERWQIRFGAQLVSRLRAALEPLVGAPGARSPLFEGLEPPPGGWRASVRSPETLPHFPMVLHRGGYPDGS